MDESEPGSASRSPQQDSASRSPQKNSAARSPQENSATRYGNFEVRADLLAAIDRAWERLAGPGTWCPGSERLAIAAEVRNASTCAYCRDIVDALSPFAVAGEHATHGVLDAVLVDVIHRARNDSGRLTRSWYERVTGGELSDAQVSDAQLNDAQLNDAQLNDAKYAEVIGIVATVAALDTFNYALGLPLTPLPEPRPGEPTRHRPAGARRQVAWLPTLDPRDVGADDPDPYPGKAAEHTFHIHQALSLAPAEAAGFFDLDEPLYLPQAAIRDFDNDWRALSHAQMELVAARLSALNRCTY